MSDSKGDFLERQSKRADAYTIEKISVWLTKKTCRNTEDAVDWVIRNYEYRCDKYGYFTHIFGPEAVI